jgi:hypothetical protein
MLLLRATDSRVRTGVGNVHLRPQINWWEEGVGFVFPFWLREAFVFPLNTTVVGQEFRSFQIKNLTPGVFYSFGKCAMGMVETRSPQLCEVKRLADQKVSSRHLRAHSQQNITR